MLRIEFTSEEIEQLHYERYYHPHPKVQKKMEAVYLKSQKLTHQEICHLCRISKPTLWRYLKQYQEGGIERIKQLDYQGQPSQLNQHAPTLKNYFEQAPPRTVAEAQEAIRRLTGIQRSPTQVRAFLKHLGMSCRKVGHVPGKPDDPDKSEEQEVFRQEKLSPLLQEAKEGKRAVYFVDAAHFVHRAFLGFVWCMERIFIASPSGRKRFNVLGALNAVTYQIITVTNETYINSESICQLLRQATPH